MRPSHRPVYARLLTIVLLALPLPALANDTAPAKAKSAPQKAAAKPAAGDAVARGRYLLKIAGCNDCHTPAYPMKNGDVPEALWLTGDALGWKGPWGTTYATNLRLSIPRMTQAEWIHYARTMQPRPPMPWFNVRAMTDADLAAIYAWAKAMGPAGAPAPAYVPPGQPTAGPVVTFP